MANGLNKNKHVFIVEIQEYCQFDTFEARCGRDEIIVMDTALYGRMNLGKHQGIRSVFTVHFQNSNLPTETMILMNRVTTLRRLSQFTLNIYCMTKTK